MESPSCSGLELLWSRASRRRAATATSSLHRASWQISVDEVSSFQASSSHCVRLHGVSSFQASSNHCVRLHRVSSFQASSSHRTLRQRSRAHGLELPGVEQPLRRHQQTVSSFQASSSHYTPSVRSVPRYLELPDVRNRCVWLRTGCLELPRRRAATTTRGARKIIRAPHRVSSFQASSSHCDGGGRRQHGGRLRGLELPGVEQPLRRRQRRPCVLVPNAHQSLELPGVEQPLRRSRPGRPACHGRISSFQASSSHCDPCRLRTYIFNELPPALRAPPTSLLQVPLRAANRAPLPGFRPATPFDFPSPRALPGRARSFNRS